jgi:hypothetical protein
VAAAPGYGKSWIAFARQKFTRSGFGEHCANASAAGALFEARCLAQRFEILVGPWQIHCLRTVSRPALKEESSRQDGTWAAARG